MIPQIDFFVFNKGLTHCKKAWTKKLRNMFLFSAGDRVATPEMTFIIIARAFDTSTRTWRLYGETVVDTCLHLRDLKSNEPEPPHPLSIAGWEKVPLTPQQLLEVNSK